MITITKGPGTYSRQKTDENGVRLEEIENIDYPEDMYYVESGKSAWLVEAHLLSIKEDGVYQGENILAKGADIVKTNFE